MTITMISFRGRQTNYRRISLEQMVDELRTGRYAVQLQELRSMFSTGEYELMTDYEGETEGYTLRGVPCVCFTSSIVKTGGDKKLKSYNRLVLLEINNLPDMETARELRNATTSLPYTLLSFVGGEGTSVKIVCQVQAASRELDADLDAEVSGRGWKSERLQRFHANAYRHLRKIYSDQLGVSVDLVNPTLDVFCQMSADADAYFCPEATAYVTERGSQDIETDGFAEEEGDEQLDMTFAEACRRRYHQILAEAYTACAGLDGTDQWADAMLAQLACNCRKARLPIEYCINQLTYSPDLAPFKEQGRVVFESYYARMRMKPASTTGELMKVKEMGPQNAEHFLNHHCQLRINSMTGVCQYRWRNASQMDFRDLTPKVISTLKHRAALAGLGIWDRDVDRYLNSDLLPEYDPVNDYLDNLPRWDGKDRLTAFAQRVKTDAPHWVEDFKVWMRSMVAHWMGKDALHGNAIVPVLIGRQGGGKTSFAAMILPPELSDYYNDNISFKTDTDLNLGLTSFALINIDEFDALSPTKHPLLKYLLSKSDVKMRPPYGKAYVQRRRMASFIATTNNPRPLTDTSGSRRFICVKTDDIDFTSRVNYDQLYAQVKTEIRQGKPYFFGDKDNRRIMRDNEQFMRVLDLPTMITRLFLPASLCQNASPLSILDIATLLHENFPTFSVNNGSIRQLGLNLRNMGYQPSRQGTGMHYRIQRIIE